MKNRSFFLSFGLLVSSLASGQSLRADSWSTGLTQPVAVIQDPTNSAVQFIVQQTGSIKVAIDGVVQATPFLTLTVLTGSERGLLGLCFDPNYASNGYFYVNYTRSGPYMQLSRFKRSANPLVADPNSELHLFRTLRPFSNHNSGTIVFGIDGYLYLPTGDGGSEGDPQMRGQNPNDLLGKMLRIDPHGDDFPSDAEANYHIPVDNPFLDGNPVTALPEIWAFGYRNAWKFSFDDVTKLGTGAMVLGDVGDSNWEEVDYEPVGKGARNYGWSHYEGNSVFNNSHPMAYLPHQPPIHVYDHSIGNCITGGYVYRGLQLGPEYFGRYFFGDYVAGRVWSAGLTIDPVSGEATVADVVEHTSDFNGQLGAISSFGVDADGELFAVNYSGGVYRIVRPNTTWLSDVSRADGTFVGGQVRSLIKQDGKLLEMSPLQATASVVKTTALVVGTKTNIANGQTIDVSMDAKLNQAVNTDGSLFVKNWSTGGYDLIRTFTLTGSMQTIGTSVAAANHIRASDGRIEFKSATTYSGVLLNPTYRIQYESLSVGVH